MLAGARCSCEMDQQRPQPKSLGKYIVQWAFPLISGGSLLGCFITASQAAKVCSQ